MVRITSWLVCLFLACSVTAARSGPVFNGIDDRHLPELGLLVTSLAEEDALRVDTTARISLDGLPRAEGRLEAALGEEKRVPWEILILLDNRRAASAEAERLHETLVYNLRQRLEPDDRLGILVFDSDRRATPQDGAEDARQRPSLLLRPTDDSATLVSVLRNYTYDGSGDAFFSAIARAQNVLRESDCEEGPTRKMVLVVTQTALPIEPSMAWGEILRDPAAPAIPVSAVFRGDSVDEVPREFRNLVNRSGGSLHPVSIRWIDGTSRRQGRIFEGMRAAVDSLGERQRWIRFALPDTTLSEGAFSGSFRHDGFRGTVPFRFEVCPSRWAAFQRARLDRMDEDVLALIMRRRGELDDFRRDLRAGDRVRIGLAADQGLRRVRELIPRVEENIRLRRSLDRSVETMRAIQEELSVMEAEYRLGRDSANASASLERLSGAWDSYDEVSEVIRSERVDFFSHRLGAATFDLIVEGLHGGLSGEEMRRLRELVDDRRNVGPENPLILLGGAYFAHLDGHHSRAAEGFRAALSRLDDSSHRVLTLLLLAEALEHTGSTEEARSFRQQGLGLSAVFTEGSVRFRIHMANALARENDFAKALDVLDDAVEAEGLDLSLVRDSRNGILLSGARHYYEVADWPALKRIAKRILENGDDSQRAVAFDFLGRAKYNEGRLNEGMFLMQSALRMNGAIIEGHPYLVSPPMRISSPRTPLPESGQRGAGRGIGDDFNGVPPEAELPADAEGRGPRSRI